MFALWSLVYPCQNFHIICLKLFFNRLLFCPFSRICIYKHRKLNYLLILLISLSRLFRFNHRYLILFLKFINLCHRIWNVHRVIFLFPYSNFPRTTIYRREYFFPSLLFFNEIIPTRTTTTTTTLSIFSRLPGNVS